MKDLWMYGRVGYLLRLLQGNDYHGNFLLINSDKVSKNISSADQVKESPFCKPLKCVAIHNFK